MSNKTIKFTDIEIRHYNITLGNRLVERDLGPALTLDWTFSTSKATPVDVYETEHASTSSTKRQGEALRLGVDKRVSLLVNGFGISSEKLERAMRSGQQRSNRKLMQRPSFSTFDIAAVEKSLKMGSIRNTSITSTRNQCDKMDLVSPKNSSATFLSKKRRNSDSNILSRRRTSLIKTERRKSDTELLKQKNCQRKEENEIQVTKNHTSQAKRGQFQRPRLLGRSVSNKDLIRQ